MTKLIYDTRFDNLEIENVEKDQCQKPKLLDVVRGGLSPTEYITLSNLQKHFRISRYHITNYLTEINAKAIGELININESGKRMRGVGKLVYSPSVIDDITALIESEDDLEAMKAIAKEIRES